MQHPIDTLRRMLLRPALVAIAGLLITGHLAGPAVALFPMLATEESAESESESPDETQETPTTLADRPAFGVRMPDSTRRPATATVLLELQSARRTNQAANLSPLGARDCLNGCGAILRC